MKFTATAALAALSLFMASPAALAQSWESADYVQARLIGGSTPATDMQTLPAGFDMRLSEGWHAYWRMPGEGGLPPRFDWSGSENVAEVTVRWPTPERFDMAGIYSFGYSGGVLLPLEVRRADAGKPATLAVKAAIMVCRDICVPQKLELSLPLDANAAAPEQARLDKALGMVPHQGELPGLKIENIVIGPEAVVATTYSQVGYDEADLFVEAGELIISAPPEVTPDVKDPRRAMIRVAAPPDVDNLTAAVMGRNVTLTLKTGNGAVEKTVSFKE